MPANLSEKFIKLFKGYEDNYVIIGGTATSLILSSYGLESRTTKDYDMVLTNEGKNEEFYNVLTKFLDEGEYSSSYNDEKVCLYRFATKKEGYPKLIELFSTKPDFILKGVGRTTPVPFAKDMSLSALLLDEDYYNLLCAGKIIVSGYSVLNNTTLIVFKAKAWLDLSNRKLNGEELDSNKIKKHLNDIARLCGSLTENDVINLSSSIQADMNQFLQELKDKIYTIPSNKDIILSKEEVYELLEKLFLK